MPHTKTLAPIIICLILLALSGCKGNKNTPPESFQIGEDSAPALHLPDGGGILDDSTQPGEDGQGGYTYTYQELPDAAALAEEYAALLTQEDSGFSPVDGELAETDLPDFTREEGTVSLVKPSVQEGRLLQIDLAWSQGQCVVTVSTPEGELKPQPDPSEAMTLREAVEYLQTLSPARLGLDPDRAMSDYVIYPKTGAVFVDGVPCLELDLYQRNPEDTLDFVACYLVSGDKRNLYRLDYATNTVEAL